MKNKYIITIVLTSLFFVSCTDFLSEIPDNRTELDSPGKISEILVNAYPMVGYLDFAETMSDNVFDTGVAGPDQENTQYYNWETPQTVGFDTPAAYWDACYSAIAHANQALAAIKKVGDKKEYDALKGEALLARAYSHYMLVTFWAKAYNPTTAATDLGIPYVLEPETKLLNTYKRNTVAEVFDYIQRDIEEGLKYVSSNYKHPKFHFTELAAKAFASRFYLVKGDWAKVLELSSSMEAKPIGKLREYQPYTTISYKDAITKYGSSTENTNLLLSSVNSLYDRRPYSSRFYFTGIQSNSILGIETSLYNKTWWYLSLSYDGGIKPFIPKFGEYFKYTNISAGIGEPFISIVLLSNDEFYLNKIEAYVMTNQLDLAREGLDYFLSTRTVNYNATTDIVTDASILAKYPLIVNEFKPFYSLTNQQKSYLKAIVETRRREFLQEGLRWLDIKRLNIEVKHSFTDAATIILKQDDNKRAMQLPAHVLANGLEKNPR